MSVYVSKNEICDYTLGLLGNNGTVSDIDTPVSDVDTIFARFYDLTRQSMLKKLLPNFALRRRRMAQVTNAGTFGYANTYEYPQDCLKLLGVGEISDRRNNYVVEANESGTLRIYTDEDYTDGLPIRFIYDEQSVGRMTVDFILAFANELAKVVALPITQDFNKLGMAKQGAAEERMASSALNAQENRPVRVSESRFKMSRYSNPSSLPLKK